MIKIYYKNTKTKQPEIISEYRKGSWVYVENPTQEEILSLEEELSLEEGHLKDALDIHEVPRLENEDGTTYVFTRFAYTENGQIETAPLLIILKKNLVVTLLAKSFPRLENLLESKKLHTTTNKTRLFISIYTQATMTFNDYLNMIGKKVRSSTTNLERVKNRDIIQFVTYENVLNDFILALVRSSNILHSFLPGKILPLNDDEHDLAEDVSLYIGQLIQIANENLRTIVNIREAYSTIMTNNLNRVIKLFTSLTVVLTIPTIISSFYGMNVPLPFSAQPAVFFGILSLTLAIVIAVLILFYRRDWL